MVREDVVYCCTKCRMKGLGEELKETIEKHEKIRARGRKKALEGLIVKSGTIRGLNVISVIYKEPLLSVKHEVLYNWNQYYGRSLKEKDDPNFRETIENFLCLFGDKGFTAEKTIDTLLCSPKNTTMHKSKQLSQRYFKEVTNKLRKKYPELYADFEFKRVYKG